MVTCFDWVVSPTRGVVRISIPQRSLHITSRIVAIHIIRSVQADVKEGVSVVLVESNACDFVGGRGFEVQRGTGVVSPNDGIDGETKLRRVR